MVGGWPWEEWKEDGTFLGWYKSGGCPRCQHTMSVYQQFVHAVVKTDTVSARCNCRSPHAQRPDTATDGGCGVGSEFGIEIPAK